MNKRRIPHFTIWKNRMNFRTLEEAGKAIGITGRSTVSALSSGKRDLSTTERLAMSAVSANLKPWTPEPGDDEQPEASPGSPGTTAS